ncbi:hypothetical protein IV102_12685 [bacterium]|nr:hypothetical protein [bacterium]
MADEVQLSRNTLGALVVALMISLMGVAYLLGKQSGPGSAPGAQTDRSSGASPSPEAPPTSRPLVVGPAPMQSQPQPNQPQSAPTQPPVQVAVVHPELPDNPVPTSRLSKTAPQTQTPVISATPASSKCPGSTPPLDAATAKYFAKIDEAMRDTAAMGDTNQFATEILQQGMNGNTEGFDNLIESTRRAQVALQNIQPPPICQEHYTLLKAQLEQSISLLNRVKSATVSLDSTALTSLAGEGRGMQAEADRFKALDEGLRQRTRQ